MFKVPVFTDALDLGHSWKPCVGASFRLPNISDFRFPWIRAHESWSITFLLHGSSLYDEVKWNCRNRTAAVWINQLCEIESQVNNIEGGQVVPLHTTRADCIDSFMRNVDQFSEQIILEPTKTSATTKDVNELLESRWIRCHGTSQILIHDNDSRFKKHWKAVTQAFGIKSRDIPGCVQHIRGSTDKVNSYIYQYIRMFCTKEKDSMYMKS